MKTYITVIDPHGATLGYTDQYVPISHRVMYEKKNYYGFESLSKVFDSHADLIDLLNHAIVQPNRTVGWWGKFQWTVEQCD